MKVRTHHLLCVISMLVACNHEGPNTSYDCIDPEESSSADGINESAVFTHPVSITADGTGDLFVAEATAVRRLSREGEVTTIAGSPGKCGYVDGVGNIARFKGIKGIVSDKKGSLYIADSLNEVVRKLQLNDNQVTTFAGLPGVTGTSDGIKGVSRLSYPRALYFDETGMLIVSSGNLIRVIDKYGTIKTLVGHQPIFKDSKYLIFNPDGLGPEARLQEPMGITGDADGNIYFSDGATFLVRKISPSKMVTTIAGTIFKHGGDDGPVRIGRLYVPSGIVRDSNGNLFVADSHNGTIREISTDGVLTTFAGRAGERRSQDGNGSEARFMEPMGMTIDRENNLYVTDYRDGLIRKISPGGVVTTVAGRSRFKDLTK